MSRGCDSVVGRARATIKSKVRDLIKTKIQVTLFNNYIHSVNRLNINFGFCINHLSYIEC